MCICVYAFGGVCVFYKKLIDNIFEILSVWKINYKYIPYIVSINLKPRGQICKNSALLYFLQINLNPNLVSPFWELAEKCGINPDCDSLLFLGSGRNSEVYMVLRKQRQGLETLVHCGFYWYPHEPSTHGPLKFINSIIWCHLWNKTVWACHSLGLCQGAGCRSFWTPSPSKLLPSLPRYMSHSQHRHRCTPPSKGLQENQHSISDEYRPSPKITFQPYNIRVESGSGSRIGKSYNLDSVYSWRRVKAEYKHRQRHKRVGAALHCPLVAGRCTPNLWGLDSPWERKCLPGWR